MEEQNTIEMSETAKARRDFLRKSVYAACATPVIMTLLVERADAAHSTNPGLGFRPYQSQNEGPHGGDANAGQGVKRQNDPKPGRWYTNIPKGQEGNQTR